MIFMMEMMIMMEMEMMEMEMMTMMMWRSRMKKAFVFDLNLIVVLHSLSLSPLTCHSGAACRLS